MIKAFTSLSKEQQTAVIKAANRKLSKEGVDLVRYSYAEILSYGELLDAMQRDYSNMRQQPDIDRLFNTFYRCEMELIYDAVDLLRSESRTGKQNDLERSRIKKEINDGNVRFSRLIRLATGNRFPSELRAIEKKRADRAKAREQARAN